jgi:hypothetical protein
VKAGGLLGLFFDPDDEGGMFPRNIGYVSTDYTVLTSQKYLKSYTVDVSAFLQ